MSAVIDRQTTTCKDKTEQRDTRPTRDFDRNFHQIFDMFFQQMFDSNFDSDLSVHYLRHVRDVVGCSGVLRGTTRLSLDL